MSSINKNTYYMLPTWFIHSAMSISRAKSGKYHLNKRDNKKGYYVNLNMHGINLKVPFSALFEVNNKIKPIKGLSFSDSLNCPSAKRGLCQLDNSNLLCYAKIGQKRAKNDRVNKGAYKGVECINSLYHSFLVMSCLNVFYEDIDLLNKFSAYINKYVPIVRFNLKGDFRDLKDLYILSFLVNRAFKSTFYGYTARDDLLGSNNNINDNFLKYFGGYDNFYLNGSNIIYTNRFKATYDLREWLSTTKICLGGCNKCKKCYTLKNSLILCLIHGKNSGIKLNTWLNREFLITLFNSLNTKDSPLLTHEDLKVYRDILDSLNHALKNKLNIDLSFKSWWDLREWLHSLHYEALNMRDDMRDYKKVMSLGVI